MRILIVEDEPDLLASLAQALREEGYAVDTADNGDDGLFNAEGTDYDAMVLDVMLPKAGRLGNFQAPSQNQKDARAHAHRPRPVARPRARPRHRRGRLRRQAVRSAEIFARLRAIIRRSANKTTNVIEIGAVKIDTAARQVLQRQNRGIHRARIFAGGISRAASRRSRHAHAALRASFRRERKLAVQSARRSRFQRPQKTRRGIHRHPARPRLLHRVNENIQHPTSNNQQPMPGPRGVSLDVRCWMLVVGCSEMKIFKSIKWRLQLWYGLILALTIAAGIATSYQMERDRLFADADRNLHVEFQNLIHAVHLRPFSDLPPEMQPPPPPEMQPPEERFPDPYFAKQAFASFFQNIAAAGYYSVIWLPDGKELVRSTNAPTDLVMPTTWNPGQIARGESQVHDVSQEHGNNYELVVSMRVRTAGL